MERYLKLFTFVSLEEIASLMEQHSQDPGKRMAQHLLASEVLELVHGRETADATRAEHQSMRNPNLSSLNSRSAQGSSDESGVGKKLPRLPRSRVINAQISKVLHDAGLAASKSEAARLINSGGVYVATKIDADADADLSFSQIKNQFSLVDSSMLVDGKLVLRLGKWKTRVIDVAEDDVTDAAFKSAEPGSSQQ